MRNLLQILIPLAVVVGGGIAAYAVAPLVSPTVAHDRAMARFARSLRVLQVEGAVVDRGAAFGLLWGNGNHCDVRGWLVVDSVLASDAFVAALPREVALAWPFSPDRPQAPLRAFEIFEIVGVDVPRRDGTASDVRLWESDRAIEEVRAAVARLDPPAPGRHRYLLRATDQANTDWDLGDVRCH